MNVKQSIFQRVFGSGKKGENEPTPQEAIQRLRGLEEMLLKKSDFIETKVESEIAIARKNGTRNKRVALQALKRKKRYEKQLQQIDGTLSTIEFQRESLENATTNTEVLKTMGSAAKALKTIHNNIDVDKVNDLMDDVMEQQDLAEEINNTIAFGAGFNRDVDEDELLDELEGLMQEEITEDLLRVGPVAADFPSIPSTEPSVSRKGLPYQAGSSTPRPKASAEMQ